MPVVPYSLMAGRSSNQGNSRGSDMRVRQVVKADSLDDLVRLGMMTKQAATFLDAAVASGLNVLVAGGKQPGGNRLVASPVRRSLVAA